MSIFSTIINDVKSWASKFEAEFVKLFKTAPSWLTIVSGVLSYAGPIVATLVTLVAGAPAGTATAAILAVIQKDIAVAQTAIVSADATTDVPALLASLKASLPALLAAAKVENISTVADIEKYVNLLIPEIDALIASAPKAA
jgi:hypothetical protein